MRIVFAGTPEFAVPCLRAALQATEVVGVYTQPDRPAGRGRALTPSPIKREALQRGIPVFQPHTLRTRAAREELRALQADLMVVVAYGLLLPPKILAIPQYGCWNVHASLLPRWRGAAPIQRAIEAGDTETGVCLMQMEAGLDTGPVLLRKAMPIGPDTTGGELHDALSILGAQVLADGLKLQRLGVRAQAIAQPAEGVTYAHKLEKADARLDWARSPASACASTPRARCRWRTARRRAACCSPGARASTSPAATARCASSPCSATAAARCRRPTTSTRGVNWRRVVHSGARVITARLAASGVREDRDQRTHVATPGAIAPAAWR